MSTLLHVILDRAPALATLAPECKGCHGTLCKGCHGTEHAPGCPSERSSPGFRMSLQSSLTGFAPLDSRGRPSLRLELFLQPLPNLKVLMIKLRGLQRKLRRLAYEARLKHERHCVLHVNRFQFGIARLFKSFSVRPVASH